MLTMDMLQVNKIKISEECSTKRILGECLLISSLPGKVLRMLVDIARLAERFQHAFEKPSLVNLISKDANLVFYLSQNSEEFST